MKIYELKPYFSPTTGKQEGEILTFKEQRCDYCGEVMPDDDMVGYTIDYGSCDPCYGASGEEFELIKKFKLSQGIFDPPYVFCGANNTSGIDTFHVLDDIQNCEAELVNISSRECILSLICFVKAELKC